MGWSTGFSGVGLNSGLSFLFLWMLIGFGWVYRDANRRELPSPKLRGIAWGWLGLVGLFNSLHDIRALQRSQLRWLGGSILLFALWAVLIVSTQDWPGLRTWALFVAGLYVLYWQFSREPAREDEPVQRNE